jgi:hypothetical protein
MISAMNSYDQSHFDQKYFIDRYKYNCPYCNRKSVTYSVVASFSFDWSNESAVYGYRVKCGGDLCQKTSLHLSKHHISLSGSKFWSVGLEEGDDYDEYSIQELPEGVDLDSLFFYHQPTTFFTIDSRVNEKIRKLIAEAEGCSKMNYLVGASGCLRKAIYELLKIEQIPDKDEQKNEIPYADRIKVLKTKYPTVPPEYFDALSNIQGMTSKQLHEGDWKPFDQKSFRFLVEISKEVLAEIYVRPQEKSSVLQKILSLKPESNEPETKTDD